jgi:hypothetical protein
MVYHGFLRLPGPLGRRRTQSPQWPPVRAILRVLFTSTESVAPQPGIVPRSLRLFPPPGPAPGREPRAAPIIIESSVGLSRRMPALSSESVAPQPGIPRSLSLNPGCSPPAARARAPILSAIRARARRSRSPLAAAVLLPC